MTVQDYVNYIIEKLQNLIQNTNSECHIAYNKFKKGKDEELQSLIDNIKSIIKTTIKIILALIIIAVNSILFCYIIDKIFAPHKDIDFPFSFCYSETNESFLISEIFVPCRKKKKKANFAQCINDLPSLYYDVYINLDVANRGEVLEDKNYEIELDFHTIDGEISKFKQIFFFDNGSVKDYVRKLNIMPTRLVFNKKEHELKIIENYFNGDDDIIQKIDIILKSRNINMFKTRIIFRPKNYLIRRLYGKFRFIILFISFIIGYSTQVVFCVILLILRILFSKVEKDD